MATYKNTPNQEKAALPAQGNEEAPAEGAVRVDGYRHVLEMLQYADPEFRESLLKRLAAHDRKLANQLRAQLDT